MSVASTFSKVSTDATMAMVIPVIHTSLLVMALKRGKVNWPMKSLKLSGTGRVTR